MYLAFVLHVEQSRNNCANVTEFPRFVTVVYINVVRIFWSCRFSHNPAANSCSDV